ncbi:MAG: hypothetical protein U0232_26255 [Thermomicrobiales bacterium]
MNNALRPHNEAFIASVAVGYEQAERGELISWTPEARAESLGNVKRKAREGHQPNADITPPDPQIFMA